MNRSLSSFAKRARLFWGYLSVALVATLLFAACGGGGTTTTSSPTATSQPATLPSPTATSTPTVVMVKIVEKDEKYSFQPATLTIKAGTQVEWLNTSDAPHTVTSDTAGVFGSSSITENQTFKFTFVTAGTFPYHCTIHPYMKATITVTS